jgi:nucleoside triphosphate pyrophosphatase
VTVSFDLYLASASPRRRELLEQLGIHYRLIADLDVDESLLSGEAPDEYVMRLACDKARAGVQVVEEKELPDAAVLGADTCIALDGRILGKPDDKDEAITMLEALSGRCHEVLTAICLMRGRDVQPALSRSTVTFAALTAEQIEAYWHTGEPADKAGAYAIQGYAARYITRLEGSYSGVVGLPLYELSQLLRAT